MPVFDIFSKRQKRSRGEVPDEYQYETIPEELRAQVVHILQDAFGYSGMNTERVYKLIYKVLCREYGMLVLPTHSNSLLISVVTFFIETKDTEKAIDVIEVSFRCIDRYIRNKAYHFEDSEISPYDAIDELNQRFREHGVGYQYESGQIIRVDSQFIHSEAVQPVLKMLADPIYEGANAEFLSAHEHYRSKRYKECMNDCLKAFESCIKSICETKGWAYNNKDTANRLIGIVFEHKLIPAFMQSHFSALRSTLESGVPTVRNDQSAHGQGSKEVPVPEYIAAYMLHLTASNILLLVKANEDMK